MQWWNDLVDWLSSDDGWRVLSATVIPFIAIIVAGLIAALIGRAATKRLLAFQNRELKASAIATLIGVGRKAASWSSLSTTEQQHYDTLISEADARMRLLPVSGSTVAADWAAHQIGEMKKNSAIFSFQAEQTLEEFRDRLIEWQHKPSRARKLLKYDLEQWKFQKPTPEQDLSVRQQEWSHQQQTPAATAKDVAEHAPAPTTALPAAASSTSAAQTSTASTGTVQSGTASTGTAQTGAVPTTVLPAATEAAPTTAATPASPAAPEASANGDQSDAADSPAGYAPPMAANSVRNRITPPTDD